MVERVFRWWANVGILPTKLLLQPQVLTAKLFSSHNKIQCGKYEIDDCDPCDFEQLLFLLYTGTLQASAQNENLLQLANEYEIATLQALCESALEKRVESTDDVLMYLALLKLTSFF